MAGERETAVQMCGLDGRARTSDAPHRQPQAIRNEKHDGSEVDRCA